MPTNEELYQQADQLKDAGKLEESVAKLNEILTQDDDYALAHTALAVVLGKLGRHDEAVRHAERACQIEPNDAFNFTALSVTYQRAFAGTGNRHYIAMAEEAMARSRMMQGH
jgi:tetratricopeptide (TPR) repeat protein